MTSSDGIHALTGWSNLSESSRTFCHPKMQFLLDYDKEHHSEFAYTLYMYLTHERNLAATSEAMDMHRTSLVYRVKRTFAIRFRYLLMNAVALRPVSGSF